MNKTLEQLDKDIYTLMVELEDTRIAGISNPALELRILGLKREKEKLKDRERDIFYREAEISRVIYQTRMEATGMPLKRLGKIIADELDSAEAQALGEYLIMNAKAKK